ncbi:sulfurtransferase TusA family protein [Thioalbus denitrificans]|uniref:tRNA 2-thiouridine synthesizing protein A n=1 Tax=Thioalbus denitrificans TaxID=547122 RepID=A0A369CDE5_9GAMM|nr:sulfurtransferase TusA family protein [Thioalbus denitrificans]RCX31155.1 tRNA 2-thiouridine synthesizing protein A [Thioalbus denitrificans]
MQQLDARNLQCPFPVLRANRVLAALPAGSRLEVLATGACIEEHFRVYCERNGHLLLEYSETSGVHRLLIERGEGPPKRPR